MKNNSHNKSHLVTPYRHGGDSAEDFQILTEQPRNHDIKHEASTNVGAFCLQKIRMEKRKNPKEKTEYEI